MSLFQLDDSVELIAKKPDLIELSDDEAEMMPPPTMPAPKVRKPRTTKKQSTVTTSVKVKEEPVEEAETAPKRSTRSKKPTAKAAAALAKAQAQETAAEQKQSEESEVDDLFDHFVPKVRNSSLANASTLSTETSVTTAEQQQQQKEAVVTMSASQPVTEVEKTRSKARTKSKKPVIDKVTKLVIPEPPVEEPQPQPEQAEVPVVEVVVAPVKETITKKTATTTKKASAAIKKNSSKKLSNESVYEDAKSDSKLYNSQVSLENMQQVRRALVYKNETRYFTAVQIEFRNISSSIFFLLRTLLKGFSVPLFPYLIKIGINRQRRGGTRGTDGSRNGAVVVQREQ